jgi:hypothetical protein
LFKNNVADEADFCEAYKSQVLNNDVEEQSSPVTSILIILFLLALIITLSIFGYNYITNTNSNESTEISSVQIISDEDLKVREEVETPVKAKKVSNSKEIEKVVVKSFSELPKAKGVDINDLADKIKIDISENEKNNSKNEKKVTEGTEPTKEVIEDSTNNSTYVEDLARLTEEINKDRK